MLTDVIHTVTVELQCGDEESALAAQRGFQSHFSPMLQQLIDEEIAASGWADRVLTIDKIEIDLGEITTGDLGSADLFGRFRSAFRDQLRRAAAATAGEPGGWPRVRGGRNVVVDDAGAGEPSWSSAEGAQLAMLQEFLLTGLLPWWADMASARDVGRLFETVLDRNATNLLHFLRRYRFNVAVVQRLCDVVEPETLRQVAQRMWEISFDGRTDDTDRRPGAWSSLSPPGVLPHPRETSPDLKDDGFPTRQHHLPPKEPSDPHLRDIQRIPEDLERLLQRMFEASRFGPKWRTKQRDQTDRSFQKKKLSWWNKIIAGGSAWLSLVPAKPGGSSTPGSSPGAGWSPGPDGEWALHSAENTPAHLQLLRILALLASLEPDMDARTWTADSPADSGTAAGSGAGTLSDDRYHSRPQSTEGSGNSPDASRVPSDPPPADDSGPTDIATRFSDESQKPSPFPRPAKAPSTPPAHRSTGRGGPLTDQVVSAPADAPGVGGAGAAARGAEIAGSRADGANSGISKDASGAGGVSSGVGTTSSGTDPIDAILRFLGVDRALNKLSWPKRNRLNQLIQRENIQGKEDQKLLRGLLSKLDAEQKNRLAFLAGLSAAEMQQLIGVETKHPPGADTQQPRGADAQRPTAADQQRLTDAAFMPQGPAATDRLFIHNAGLCLLSAYLPTLFKRLGYVRDGAFLNADAQARAINLLQWLATGTVPAGEYQLAFNKLVCGWPLEMPPARIRTLKKQEIKEAGGLLESVIQHWPALKKTSAAGLRSSFLQREGLLSEGAGFWTLKVERKDYDLLLGTIGWSYQLIKHPWMKKHVRVEW